MNLADNWPEIFKISSDKEFETLALEVFRYQSQANPVYREYIGYLGVKPESVANIKDIPFLPIELFKTHRVIVDGFEPELTFESSGTTGQIPSRHYVAKAEVYEQSFIPAFRQAFGELRNMCLLALLPSYLERNNSSLVYMADKLIQLSGNSSSGFFLNNLPELAEILKKQSENKQPTVLIGVSFALLDLAEAFPMPLGDIKVIETGGMKGRRRELTRAELQDTLKKAFSVDRIYSEYGMTELLSQAYTDGAEWFSPPAWMKVIARDLYDPLNLLQPGSTGGINVIDLANIFSCSFIATGDMGEVKADGRFSILGRIDNSDIRGCNLMIETDSIR